jgi:hypothetical protein
MRVIELMTALAVLAATPATADSLSQMGGTWQGTGWARETPQGPQETLRCRITNTYDAATLTLTLKGLCAVPGRRIDIGGRLSGTQGSTQVSGRWSNPDGIGSVPVSGLQRDGLVAFTFAATEIATGRDLAQNVEWRVSEGELRLRSTDRADPTIHMSDISFSR